ncbi:MAG: oxidative damage protection protein [Gammaproteobacteria bacterium]|jgi:Fe-S cluster biosynthesis and repair protein YggX|nr:oxidative damage protection protein [Gammaproteobacteria bacterium]
MINKVHCVVLGRESEALERAPWPGELGQRILREVSREGWQQWLAKQTILMNEGRLSPMNPEHRAYLETQMEAFIFGDGGEDPEGWVPPEPGQS